MRNPVTNVPCFSLVRLSAVAACMDDAAPQGTYSCPLSVMPQGDRRVFPLRRPPPAPLRPPGVCGRGAKRNLPHAADPGAFGAARLRWEAFYCFSISGPVNAPGPAGHSVFLAGEVSGVKPASPAKFNHTLDSFYDAESCNFSIESPFMWRHLPAAAETNENACR